MTFEQYCGAMRVAEAVSRAFHEERENLKEVEQEPPEKVPEAA